MCAQFRVQHHNLFLPVISLQFSYKNKKNYVKTIYTRVNFFFTAPSTQNGSDLWYVNFHEHSFNLIKKPQFFDRFHFTNLVVYVQNHRNPFTTEALYKCFHLLVLQRKMTGKSFFFRQSCLHPHTFEWKKNRIKWITFVWKAIFVVTFFQFTCIHWTKLWCAPTTNNMLHFGINKFPRN